MPALLEMPTPFLSQIAEKIYKNERLTEEEGLCLFNCKSPLEKQAIRALANEVRQKKVGQAVHFASTLYIHPTNLCELNCPLCSFYAKPGWTKAWFLTPKDILKKVESHLSEGINEIHVVGGLWRDCNLDYYKEVFQGIKSLDPKLHIKALTPVEYDFLAKLHKMTIEDVFLQMMSWGLGSLPGGGAEVLVEEIRKKIAPGKITSDEYLAIHEKAHKLGLKSNITMLYGHIEEEKDLLTHMMKIRSLQDKTQGFRTFIPLKFGLENNALGKRKQRLKEKDTFLVYAISRLMLDNIPHLKVLWNYVGIETALDLLNWGGNDLSSTNREEMIITMAGSVPVKMDLKTLSTLISNANRIPVLAHSGAI